jgi:hypothetical protein
VLAAVSIAAATGQDTDESRHRRGSHCQYRAVGCRGTAARSSPTRRRADLACFMRRPSSAAWSPSVEMSPLRYAAKPNAYAATWPGYFPRRPHPS